MRLQGMGGDAGIVPPDLLQQSLARYRVLPGAIEIAQDGGFLLGEPDLVSFRIEQNLRAGAKGIGPDGEYCILARLVLAQLGADARQENGKTKWLGHVVVG